MSKKARKKLQEMVAENGKMEWSECLNQLQDEMGVSQSTAINYVYSYCNVEQRNGGRVVLGMENMNVQETHDDEDDKEEKEEEVEFDGDVSNLDMEAGERTSQMYENLTKLKDNGHPLIPDLGHEYLEREMYGMKDTELVTRTMSDDDYCTLLIGETGCGKDTLIIHICDETNRPMVRVNFGIDVTYEELVGHYAPDGDGGFEWQDGILTTAVRNGWVFVADELNAATGEATMPLHGLTEDKDNRELVIREAGEIIDPHPEFEFVATMNPLGYAGTNDINQAFKDRFYPIHVDYMDGEDEETLLTERTGLKESQAKDLVNMANKLRMNQKEGEIQTPVSTRSLVKIGKMADVMGIQSAAHMILEGTAKNQDVEIISKVIDTHITEQI